MENKKPLIIGFDPGTTAAIAALDLKTKEITLLYSSKNLNQKEITEKIIETGKPVLIGTDKAKKPSKVIEIANSLGISIYCPQSDLETEEKKKLGKGSNDHEIDASAAAQKAYNKNIEKIKKAKEIAKKEDQEASKVLKKYFNGENIKNQTEKTQKPDKNEESQTKSQEEFNDSVVSLDKHKRLKRKNQNLEKQIEQLKQKNRELEKDKENLKSKNTRLKQKDREEIIEEREFRKLKSKLKDKDQKISELKRNLEESRIREETYRRVLDKINSGEAELLQKIDQPSEIKKDERAVTKVRELAEKHETIIYKENAKGIELPNYYLLTGKKAKNSFKTLLQNYKEKRRKNEL